MGHATVLDCGCHIAEGGGRTWCPTCLDDSPKIDPRDARIAALEEALRGFVAPKIRENKHFGYKWDEAGTCSDDQCVHCIYCNWSHEDYHAMPQHEVGCPILQGRTLLEGETPS